MGKNLRQQRRGKGSGVYKNLGHRQIGRIIYKATGGIVKDIVHARGRMAPVAVITSNGKDYMNIAHSSVKIGQSLDKGTGSIQEIGGIPEGTKIFNIEVHPMDGGKLCRSSGAAATIVGHDKKKTVILLPSKRKKTLSSRCRATLGSAAGFGRKEKPFRKAGNKYHAMRSRNKQYPRVSGVSMNAVDHPFGGTANPGKHKTVSRGMPPGRKVGSIAARRTGKKKGK